MTTFLTYVYIPLQYLYDYKHLILKHVIRLICRKKLRYMYLLSDVHMTDNTMSICIIGTEPKWREWMDQKSLSCSLITEM